MERLRRAMAVALSIVLMMTVLPQVSRSNETKAAETFAITSPTANRLVAAGYIDIKWSEAKSNTVKDYELYIDNQKVTTTTKTTYEYYTTKVKSFEVYAKANFADGTSANTDKITFGVSKKGLGLAYDMGQYLDLADMGVAWYYNWGVNPSSGQQYQGIEFVPMQWGPDSYENINNKMNNWAAKGYKYALAFNEPDLSGQGVISVNDAVNRWPAFQNHGVRVGSPASYLWPTNSDWLKNFMVKIDNNVDFVTIHCYPDNNPGGASMAKWFLETVVDGAWELYHKPIWITEFSTSGASVKAEGTKGFWENVMPGLDEREYVERYAAFGFKAESNPGTALWYYGTGALTEAGEAYKNNGNPAGFTPASPGAGAFKLTESTRNTLLPKTVTLNGVTCQDFVAENGVTATATSQNNDGSGADKAIDEDITSRWESKHGIDPQALTIDLGTVRNIKQVSIVWEDASASNYTIEVSEDGQNYTSVATIENMGRKANRADSITLTQMAKARYVKINGSARTTDYGYSIFDVAIYGTDNAKVDETTTKVQPTTTVVSTTAKPQDTNTTKQLSVLNGATFVGYVGSSWTNADATVNGRDNGDAIINITNSGKSVNDGVWGIQAQYQKIKVVNGATYTYTSVIQSSVAKKMIVKITPSGVDRSLAQELVELKAGEPYTYTATFVANSDSIDITYGFGTHTGESAVKNVGISIKEVKLTSDIDNQTTASSVTTTKSNSTVGVASVTKATKKKSAAKAKISLKSVSGAAKYQIQIAKSKKFAKKSILVTKTVKKATATVKSAKMKGKKKLFVRARAIAVIGGKEQTGAWSKAKKVKIK